MIQINAKRVRSELSQLLSDIEFSANKALGEAAAFTQEKAKSTTAFKDGDGTDPRHSTGLRQSILWEFGALPLTAFVIAGAEHASFQEFGVKAFTPSRPLNFMGRGGTWVTLTSHPGIKPGKFMEEAALFGQTILESRLTTYLNELTNKFNSK